MDRLRVLLLTLPIPEPPLEIQRGNHQLFALFFRNYLRLRGEERFEILTLPRRVVDLGTNAAVVDAIMERHPDVVGFSLYLWNVERSVECARMLVQSGREPFTAGGGPEVQDDNGFLLGRGTFDFLIRGEGEMPFLALLDYLVRAGAFPRDRAGRSTARFASGLSGLPSLFVRARLLNGDRGEPALREGAHGPGADGEPGRARYVTTTLSEARVAVEEVQKGIAAMYEEHGTDDFAYLELMRGCPYACDFCSYAKNREGVSRLPLPLALDSIRALVQRNVGEIYLLAPTVNFDKGYFRALLDGISAVRREFPGRRTRFFAELKAELLDGRDADDMIEAGICEFEIGVQTLRDEGILDRVEALVAKGAKPIVDFILGLPGEDYSHCVRTVEALDRRGLLSYAVFYHLLVLPGSPLRKTAIERGYDFSPLPPYHVLKTDRMDLEDIRTVYLYLEHRKNHSYYEEPVYTDPEVTPTIRRGEDAAALVSSRSLKTGCLVVPEGPVEFGVIVDRLGAYADEKPEVFHHAFVLWGDGLGSPFGSSDAVGSSAVFGVSNAFGMSDPAGPGGPPDAPSAFVGSARTLLRGIQTLQERFRAAGNYFDRYCESLDYLDGESFSKRATVLVDPFSGDVDRVRGLLEEQALDYAYGVRIRALADLQEGAAKDALARLEREWKERGVYTVFLVDSPGASGRVGSADAAVAGARPFLEKKLGCPPGEAEGFLYYILHTSEG